MPKTITDEEIFKYHKRGKIATQITKPCVTQKDLSIAYSPGVAVPCLEIQKDPYKAYDYTAKGNLVGVITDGTAVLGLGDIGHLASKPVMEGKAVLFKKFADVDAYDIEINEKDPDKFIDIVVAIADTFGGINLEDIKAPKCFYIEEELKKRTNVPVMHDDQHGTAIITTAGLMNAIEITGKDIRTMKIVVSGAGASATACVNMYKALGAKNIIMCDSKGVISTSRDDLNEFKKAFAVDTKDKTLSDAIKNADMFLGLSVAGAVNKDMVASMNTDPILFTLANPVPEIMPEEVLEVRDDAIIGTGRSDYVNQVNNVLGFPFIFRGALDMRATHITENMKMAAARALADLAKEEVSQEVKDAFENPNLKFGKKYIIPKPTDRNVLFWVASAVAEAAVQDGVANVKNFDKERYIRSLHRRLDDTL
ncbi:MAG: NADP-dependent malic enzyme (EC [uncultured Campylobacterales bacterium]|uniref:NADP-dependent malic enzyme (EC) n=1 Tax=uncultured Campylobacterales bacterium TaxID=352960 RepID=A0A6S6S0M4_9BACT|nr:MAG: NADP-dependent malic enzyme (EC [uncultured Campylobacterales bacterium]